MAESRGPRTDAVARSRRRLPPAAARLRDPARPRILLDEPTAGARSRRFWRLIDGLSDRAHHPGHRYPTSRALRRLAIIHAGRLAAIGTTRELKQVFAGRSVVEVQTANPVAAMRALESMGEVEKCSLFGTSVHAILRRDLPGSAPLAARLGSLGLDVQSIGTVEPSLEDVFLDVVEKAGRR
jgi:ABC-2 type transport system ATP-binding protein